MENEDTTTTYLKWVIFEIYNHIEESTISVKHAKLIYGKYHKKGDRDIEISRSDVSKTSVPAAGEVDICSCGREQSPSETEGKFDLWVGDSKICKIYWKCPWGPTEENTVMIDVRPYTAEYVVRLGLWSKFGAIGNVRVEISKND